MNSSQTHEPIFDETWHDVLYGPARRKKIFSPSAAVSSCHGYFSAFCKGSTIVQTHTSSPVDCQP